LVLFLAEGCTKTAASPDASAEDARVSEGEDADIAQSPDREDPAPALRGPWAVVLVAANDVLNVREAPRADAPLVTSLSPTSRGLAGTGRTEVVGRAVWREVTTGGRRGWVNSAFITPDVPSGRLRTDARVGRLLDALASAADTKADVADLVSPRGVYVAAYRTPKWYPPAEARALFTSRTLAKFDGPACEACLEGTFADVIGGALLDAYRDADKELTYGVWKEGGNASARLPTRLAGFPFVTIYDPGDLEDAPDWLAVSVFFEYVDDAPKVVGLALNAWSP